MNSYEGSPSLAPEAREKVLQTFRHTLQLARDARNEEALLGCDFILKMDTRFSPARQLLESLRGVPSGTRVDLAPFDPFLGPAAAAPPAQAAPAPGSVFPPRPAPVAPMVPPGPAPAAPAPTGSLDDLVFDDFAAADPFGGAPAAPGPAAEAAPAPSFGEPEPPPSDEPPEAISGGFDLVQDPFGAGTEPPLAAAPGASPPSPELSPSASRVGPGPSAAMSGDPRIAQFLKQGDDALARGNPQEAIDLWSRVFLIDLSNDEASRRIDAARDQLADSSRKVDLLVSEGVQLYEAGDLPGARSKFLDVLAISEHDATARSYLNQIEAALSAPASAASTPGTDSDFMRHELEAPHPPSFADSSEPSLEAALSAPDAPGTAGQEAPAAFEARGPRRGGLDLRVVLAVGFALLLAIGGGAWWLFRGRRPRPPADAKGTAGQPAAGAASKAKPAPDDPVAKAQQLFEQGKVDAAIQALLAIPDGDPRHNEALTKIDQYRNAAAPTPAANAPGPANLEELRAQGFAALKASRYIDVVKALDPVVKARPEDAEAAQALKKAREQVDALRSAAKSYAEGDYDGAIKLLWELRKIDAKNQDVEEYLLNSYVNSGIQALQSGNMDRASAAFLEAIKIRPTDTDAQRLHKFAKRYAKGTNDLLARIFVRHLTIRQ